MAKPKSEASTLEEARLIEGIAELIIEGAREKPLPPIEPMYPRKRGEVVLPRYVPGEERVSLKWILTAIAAEDRGREAIVGLRLITNREEVGFLLERKPLRGAPVARLHTRIYERGPKDDPLYAVLWKGRIPKATRKPFRKVAALEFVRRAVQEGCRMYGEDRAPARAVKRVGNRSASSRETARTTP